MRQKKFFGVFEGVPSIFAKVFCVAVLGFFIMGSIFIGLGRRYNEKIDSLQSEINAANAQIELKEGYIEELEGSISSSGEESLSLIRYLASRRQMLERFEETGITNPLEFFGLMNQFPVRKVQVFIVSRDGSLLEESCVTGCLTDNVWQAVIDGRNAAYVQYDIPNEVRCKILELETYDCGPVMPGGVVVMLQLLEELPGDEIDDIEIGENE